jgi:hypothetical protein
MENSGETTIVDQSKKDDLIKLAAMLNKSELRDLIEVIEEAKNRPERWSTVELEFREGLIKFTGFSMKKKTAADI